MTIRDSYLDNKRNRMIKRNQNLLMCVVGGTGSGKTYSSITFADELMEGKLDPERHIVFSIEEFMTRVNEGISKGEVIVFEEAGVNISSKDWASKMNRNINKVLQTCRHLNFGVIFTVPSFKFLDNSSRLLQHGVLIANEKMIDYTKDIAKLKVYDLFMNPLLNSEPFLKIPEFWVDDQLIKMRYIHFKKPRKELLEVYEKRKTQFTEELNRSVLDDIHTEKKYKEFKDNKVKRPKCASCGGTRTDLSKKTLTYFCRSCGHQGKISEMVRD